MFPKAQTPLVRTRAVARIGWVWPLAAILFFPACSQYSQGPVSVGFHDLNSHYNAQFLANQKIAEAEKTLFDSRKDDYNELLDVLIPMDTTRGAAVKAQTEYAVKKASLPVQHHKNSHWLDDCYLALAQARYLQGDFQNATETFKYVNSESSDEALRQRALIGLLKAFTDTKNYDYATAVISRLRKEKLEKHDLVAFYEARAQFHKSRQEYDQTLAVLKQTVKRMHAGEHRARLYYIIGQLYQRNNRTKEAYGNFAKVHRSNGAYELSLQAQLQMIQLFAGSGAKAEKKLARRFRKMLRDEKNKDYQDRIYYTMGMYEYRHERYDQSIPYFRQATQAKASDPQQKALAFLRMAEIYYYRKQDYRLAKNYYDSTISAGLPQKTPNYAAILKHQKVLGDFVTHFTTLQTEDSLQRLAKMDGAARDKLFDEVLDKKDREEREAERRQDDAISQQSGAIFGDLDTNAQARPTRRNTDDANWYFANPAAMAQGKTAFTRKWGSRPLADNWRRSQKDVDFGAGPAAQNSITEKTQTPPTGKTKKPSREETKKTMLATLPMTAEAVAQSDKKIETAHHELGKIFDKELLEKNNALKHYQALLERFPKTEYAAETLYAMFLIHQEAGDAQQETVKNRLLGEYPDTEYARLAGNPNHTRDGNLTDLEADRAFREVYQLYENQNYVEADQRIRAGLQQYAGTMTEQRLKVLQIKLIGHTQGVDAYRKALQDFTAAHPKSPLMPYVQNLMSKSDR